MKRTFMCGLAAIVGMVTMAGAAMAHDAEVNVMTMDLQPDVGIFELTLMPDGADLLMGADVLAEVDVAPDGLTGAAIMGVQAVSLMATRGAASSTMVDDAMRLWRARTVDAFTISPDLLI
jgi:LPS sulfotransferase NodH